MFAAHGISGRREQPRPLTFAALGDAVSGSMQPERAAWEIPATLESENRLEWHREMGLRCEWWCGQ